MAKSVAREALWRIDKFFELERAWSREPPVKRKALRDWQSRPLVDAFFTWAEVEYAKVKDQRGLLRSAFGYALRKREALRRFLEDGRLRLDNNGSERELRRIAVGRNAWLFVGSDDHAEAAASLFSLIASCRLHELDPEAYLRDPSGSSLTGRRTGTSSSLRAIGPPLEPGSTPKSWSCRSGT